MKKLVLLFLSFVLAVGVNAEKLSVLGKDSSTELVKEILTKDVRKRALPISKVMHQRSVQKVKPVAKLASALSLTADGFLVGPEFEDGEWYVAFEAQGYTFRLCWYGDKDNFTGTYSNEDISEEYSWGWYQSADLFYEIYFSEVTMTIVEEKVSECLSQIVLEATILDTQDRTYEVKATHRMFTPKTTVKHNITNSSLEIGLGEYSLKGNTTDLNVELGIISDVVEGAYTHTSFNPNKTKFEYKGIKQEILQATLLVQPSYMADGGLGYDVALSFYNQDTVLHQVTMPTPLPAAQDTIEVKCTNLDIDDSLKDFGFIMLTGDDDDYDIFAMYAGTEIKEGVYNEVAVTINPKTTWQPIESITAQLTLTQDAEGKWYAKIETYAMDYNWYSIEMSFVIPTPTRTVEVTFEQTAMATYNPGDDHTIQLLAVGDEWEASVTTVNVLPGESFSVEEVLMDYSGLYNRDAEMNIKIADINGTLSQSGDTTYIKASVIGFNAVQYDVTLWYCAPIPVDTVEIDMPVEFTNALQYGYYTLSAYTPDSDWYIALSPIANEVAGTFVNDGVFGKFGAPDGRYEFFGGNTFIYSETDMANYPIEKGELVVNVAADSSIYAEAKLIARNGVYYHIIMRSEYNEHLDYDEPYSAIYRTYTTEDYITVDDQTALYDYIYIEFLAADMSDVAAFFFYVEDSDEETIIPVGTYSIDYSEDYGTVSANPGVQGNGVLPSFYAEKTEDGSLITPLWLLVGGTVEVSQDENGAMHMMVDAYNSYGVPVYIEYDGTPIGAGFVDTQSPTVNTRKVLRNGQLLIIREGKTYNMVGTEL